MNYSPDDGPMKGELAFVALMLTLIIVFAFVAVRAHDRLQWIYGTHGGEKCYIVGSEHGNIRYPSMPFDSYEACMLNAGSTSSEIP